jgi:hypothetical protein
MPDPAPPPPSLEDAREAVALAARLAGIPLRPDWHAAAAASWLTTATAARLVAEWPLEDEAEYAPAFRA